MENEIRPGRTRPLVCMPCFGDAEPALRAFDAANAAIWRSLGFDVAETSGWGLFAPANGGIRCASKVLRRGGPSAG